MTSFGKIKSYDESAKTGYITPEQGGPNLSFAANALAKPTEVPKSNDRYGYDTEKDGSGTMRVVKLYRA